MRDNINFAIGSIAMMDKVEYKYKFFDFIFKDLMLRAKNLKNNAKLFVYNKLDKSLSLSQILKVYPDEVFEYLNFKKIPKERTLFRDLERIGYNHSIIISRYQELVKKHGLMSDEQFPDFSSTYFEGKKSEISYLGYSRDSKPGKQQITFGISTGANKIPTALTIQKGNVQDKKHMSYMIKTLKKVLEPGDFLIFDCGGNTNKNKKEILDSSLHYLTLRAKKVSTYKKYIDIFNQSDKEEIMINNENYLCVKIKEENEVKYVFFSEKLYNDQIQKKNKKFEKELEKNDSLLKKIKKGKQLYSKISREGHLIIKGSIQKVLDKNIKNPNIKGVEGFFILESSKEEDSKKILQLYKNRDKSEKLIRDMKEGTEVRPIRHWNKWSIIGYLVIVFLTNAIINLTLNSAKKPLVKNVKLLKKFLNNLTLTVVYPKNAFRFTILANITIEIRSILGNWIDKYKDKTLDLRW